MQLTSKWIKANEEERERHVWWSVKKVFRYFGEG